MAAPITHVVFDVNGTLSDLSSLSGRFGALGVDEQLSRLWFATVLRDGFALTAADSCGPFETIAREAARVLLTGRTLDRGLDDAVDHLMSGLQTVPPHRDVGPGVEALHAAGLRLLTLSNGPASTAERLLADAGVRDSFDALLSVEDAGRWKPAAIAYAHAARRCAVPEAQLLLVAAHPWDVDGAARAGWRTAWLNRERAAYPAYLTAPDFTVASLPELADRLR